MADFVIDIYIFTEEGSHDFKAKIQEKQQQIQFESVIESLKAEKEALEKVKARMSYYYEQPSFFLRFSSVFGEPAVFDENRKYYYDMYLNDISNLITQIERRIAALSMIRGGAHKRKSRRKKEKVRGGRKLTNKRKYMH